MSRKLSSKGFAYRNYRSGVLIFRDGLPYSFRTDEPNLERATEDLSVEWGIRLEHDERNFVEIEPGLYDVRVWINNIDLDSEDSKGVPLRDRIPKPEEPLRGPRYI